MTAPDCRRSPAPTPFATDGLPGVGGVVRVNPEDFQVEEIPAYAPSGTGTHLFLWVEKRDRTTREAVQTIARALNVGERDIGYAGLKDRHALTRQFLSVPMEKGIDSRLHVLDHLPEGSGVKVLKKSLHGNKLKTGHLKGNRFNIRIRDVCPDALRRAQDIVSHLAAHGLPNAYGAQRFGRDGMNALNGRALVLGQSGPQTARLWKDRFLKRLCVSAYQSLLFNRVLARRMSDGLFESAVDGDLMKKTDTGGLFTSHDVAEDTRRMAEFQISPTGPVFGHRMMRPEGEAWARESAILEEEGISLESFAHLKGDAEGSRRPLRVAVSPKVGFDEASRSLTLEFSLPKGSFATVLLREVMKDDVDVPDQLDEG